MAYLCSTSAALKHPRLETQDGWGLKSSGGSYLNSAGAWIRMTYIDCNCQPESLYTTWPPYLGLSDLSAGSSWLQEIMFQWMTWKLLSVLQHSLSGHTASLLLYSQSKWIQCPPGLKETGMRLFCLRWRSGKPALRMSICKEKKGCGHLRKWNLAQMVPVLYVCIHTSRTCLMKETCLAGWTFHSCIN